MPIYGGEPTVEPEAGALECDESEDRFNEALRSLLKNPSDKKALDTLADELGQNKNDPTGTDSA